MPPFSFGPIYCETMSATSTAFPVEPLNTISNGVIVLFGLLSLYMTIKRAPRSIDLYVLSALLILTGIGSGIWHGFRDRDALFWEVQSGLFFLFALAFFWARRLWSYIGATIFLALFIAGFSFSRQLWDQTIFGFPMQRWVALAPLLIIASIALTTQTYMFSKRAAFYSSASLGLALTALTFRTIDLSVCEMFPTGTHFLWHSFLSAGGFMSVLSLITLGTTSLRVPRTQAIPVQQAAE